MFTPQSVRQPALGAPPAAVAHREASMPPGAVVYPGDIEHAGVPGTNVTYRWDPKGNRWVNVATGLPYVVRKEDVLPPGAVPHSDLEHVSVPGGATYSWDQKLGRWVDTHTGIPYEPPPLNEGLPSLEDASVDKATLGPRKAADDAIAHCDQGLFDKAIEELAKIGGDVDTQIATLNKQIERAHAQGLPGRELEDELGKLRRDRNQLRLMISVERFRFEHAKCPVEQPPPAHGEGPPGPPVEQPVLPPSETFQPRRQPTNLEVAVLDEINKARTDPPAYAARLVPEPYVDLSDAKTFLAGHAPVAALVFDDRLAFVAIAHAEDQVPKGGVSHTGSYGSRPAERMRKVGVQTTEYAEVISIGMKTGLLVVEQLIVDQPGPNHPHRMDLFDPGLAGVGCGPNTKFGTMCVIDLARSYVPPAPPPPGAIPPPPPP
ncbi:MAG: CAP domain-containing protein [Mycobacteriales bacterium]